MEIYTFTPDEEQKNLRIDKFLSEQLPDQSRSYLQKLLKEGNVTVNEKTVKANYKVQLSDTVKLELPGAGVSGHSSGRYSTGYFV